MKSKKAQLKIQQMVFMLLAVTLFFFMVGLFYIGYKTTSIQGDVEDLKRDKAAGLVEKLSGDPEFSFEGKSNAIDSDKLMILKTENEYLFYEDGRRKTFWGVKGIIVKKIYPRGPEIECTLDTYPDCNLIKIYTESSNSPISSFVSLCTKKSVNGVQNNHCELAELIIEEEEINEE